MTALSLLVLRAKDPKRLAKVYSAFGLSFCEEKHETGPVHQTCDLGTAVLEIYPLKEGDIPTVGARLGFCVPSVTGAIRACREEVRVLVAPKDGRWGLRAVLEDPEGHKIELTERIEQPLALSA